MKKFILFRHLLTSIFFFLLFIMASISVKAIDRYVNPDGLCGGNIPCYATIQAAIDASSNGDIIHVAAGTYNESQILINKALTIIGAGLATTIIDGGGASISTSGLVRITTPGNVTFSGFTIQNAGGPLYAGDGGDNKLNVGIYAQSSVTSVTYTISSNKIIGTNDDNDEQDYGFYSHSGKESLVFTSNEITQTGANAMLLEKHEGPVDVSGNTLNAGAYGVDAIFNMTYGGLDITALHKFNNNTIDLLTGTGPGSAAGVTIASSFNSVSNGSGKFTNVRITDNTITGLKANRRGISLWNGEAGAGEAGNITDAVITGNTITGIGPSTLNCRAIQLINLVSNAIITNNAISSVNLCFRGFTFVPGTGIASGTQLSYNSFTDFTQLSWGGVTALDATCNWWGTTDNTIIASKIAGSVTYIPYLTSGTDAVPATPGFQPETGSCNGPRPAITVTVNTVTVVDNNDGLNDLATLNVCNTPGDNLFFSGFTDLHNIAPVSQLKVRQEFIHSNTVWIGPTPVDEDYLLSGYVGGFSRHIGLINPTVSGTLTMSFQVYFDANNSNSLDAGDYAGDKIIYTVTVNTLSTAPTGATGTTTICNGESTTLTVAGGSKGTGAITEWFTGSCGGTSAGTGDAITVSPTTTTTYYVRYNGTCNTTDCATVTVTVNPKPTCSITAVPSNNTYTGNIPTNLYLGYGPQSVTLNVTAITGGPFTYSWTGSPSTSNLSPTNSANPVFTATTAGSYTYTVEVTNTFGCKTTCSITICVTDIREFDKKGKATGKVYVCHAPPSNPGNAHTLSISANAVPSHLGNHAGDRLGKCDQLPCGATARQAITEQITKPEVNALTVKAMQNPSSTYFLLSIESNDEAPVTIKVMNSIGQYIGADRRVTPGSIIQVGENLKGGIYYLQVIQGNTQKVIKLMKLN